MPLLTERDIDRNPIVIEYDISQLLVDDDIFRCIDDEQVINWRYANDYKCDKHDILTDEKLSALYNTIQNLTNYFTTIIRVNHQRHNYNAYNDYSNAIRIKENNNTVSSDHKITILVRPFEDETIAITKNVQFHRNGRPLQSILILNPRVIPYQTNRYFFLLLFHEIVHALGLNEDCFPKWVDRKTGFPYETHPIVNITYPEYKNKVFYELCTPKAREVFRRRSNSQTGCLPMEENGETRDRRVHVKGTIFRQDVLAQMVTYDAVVSEVTLAVIEDMGFYSVEWTMAEPMPWGTVEFNANEDFFKKPSWKHIPDQFKFQSGFDTVSIDLRSYGKHKSKEFDEESDEFNLTSYGNLYLPIEGDKMNSKKSEIDSEKDNSANKNNFKNNQSQIDNTTNNSQPLKLKFNVTRYPSHDYLPLLRPTKFCKFSEWAFNVIIKGEKKVMCLSSSYNLSHITFSYGGVHICKSNETFVIDSRRIVICPDALYLKKIADFINQNPRNYGHIPLPQDQLVPDKYNYQAPLHDDVPNPVKFAQDLDSANKKKNAPPPTEVRIKRNNNIKNYAGFVVLVIVVGAGFLGILYLTGKEQYSHAPVALQLPLKQKPLYV
ncbi:GP63-like [Trichomonas vaginalis G3]|uniref:GP63-like n=1 Tax=Trichomonas vaginalis (strain ATCC PRA-98 / G3) TaxID=412133 RepID=A2EPX5_TRIV3|nr:regulation of choline O-acetyltransferase protein [Trichomonas vaginalis G3]EAY05313.1 GP63-like [Trichomonas vaginalis G3]KAI5531851.1 regulation of choline O-acetyltransferase protein [Trichomonas vaginalis G3]|eukprot:XP_001317536.1 GP63-like [Trichomonas vaginalis G3]